MAPITPSTQRRKNQVGQRKGASPNTSNKAPRNKSHSLRQCLVLTMMGLTGFAISTIMLQKTTGMIKMSFVEQQLALNQHGGSGKAAILQDFKQNIPPRQEPFHHQPVPSASSLASASTSEGDGDGDGDSDSDSDGSHTAVRKVTETGVAVDDPELFATTDVRGDSSTATVMGMASGYGLDVYKRFVGSLRKTGYRGHIILGVAPDVHPDVLRYFRYRNVTPKIMRWVNCTYTKKGGYDIFKMTTCAHPYPDIKIRWSRFPLQRDWLQECETCTGPVLVMDVRDSLFQLDPFGPTSPPITGLQVFQEHPNQTTSHWLVNRYVSACKGKTFHKTMLCSGSTIGTRVAMLKYLEIMYEEMKAWISTPRCRFDLNGDDQTIHNYLFYTGQLPFATSIPNRVGIVNTVGVEGAIVFKRHRQAGMDRGLEQGKAADLPFPGHDHPRTWIGAKEYNLTDEQGFFTQYDGSRSPVAHQIDRFGKYYMRWLGMQSISKDIIPPSFNDDDSANQASLLRQLRPKQAEVVLMPKEDDSVLERSQVVGGANRLPPRTHTDAGVDVTDPILYETVDLQGNSSTATVMGMASGYGLGTYKQFVGSLRRSGFTGNIILGLAPDVPEPVLRYLEYRGVQAKIMKWVKCTYQKSPNEKRDIFKSTKCSHPYPDIKIRWSRFPLQRDWLQECETCTGPVLIMDVRDSFFQMDPFGPGSPPIKGLHVFQEHPNQTTAHWLTNWPITDCKGRNWPGTMLCSGTTIGTRPAMLKYLEAMYAEMKVWIETPKCRFNINGDDQSIHNYLYYSGQLPFANSIPNRMGTVNTVGVEGAVLWKANRRFHMANEGLNEGEAGSKPFKGANSRTWISVDFNVTNEDGFFTQYDGTMSRVVHQFDRYGVRAASFFRGTGIFSDNIPQDWEGESTAAVKGRKLKTDAGVDVSDPALYETVDLKGDSSTATVMGMASGYDLETYQKFVGSLRKSGFQGNIILGVAPNVDQEVLRYFKRRNVIPKVMKWVNCTYKKTEKEGNDIFKKTSCSDPYPDIKIRWSRFPLQRDWLRDCETCTGPVLIMDVRDSFFQQDPFGPGSPPITGLQVFQEHHTQTLNHWLTEWPIRECKKLKLEGTMLCSGTTIGTRAAMLKYLEIMYEEMKIWISTPQCRFDINGDDQSIHNYLFYTNQLPFANSIPNRMGIVNTPGVEGANIWRAYKNQLIEKEGYTKDKAAKRNYPGASRNTWISTDYNLTDPYGFFTNFDGSLSRVVHQADRFGRPFLRWLEKQPFMNDS